MEQMEYRQNAEKKEPPFFAGRKELALERLKLIPGEEQAAVPFCDYFQKTAEFLLGILRLEQKLRSGETKSWSLEQLARQNAALYGDITPKQYETSYANPAYACRMLGDEFGQLLSMLYGELRSTIVYAYEDRQEELLVFTELFLQVYGCFEEGQIPPCREIKEILYWFFSDYSELFMTGRVREQVDETCSFAADIITRADLNDLRYLYAFGEYITDDEIQTAEYLNSLPKEEIEKLARTMAEGYRMGFVNGGKDLSKKKTVNIRYHLGFERIIRQVIEEFDRMGLKPVIYRAGAGSLYSKAGYEGACPNPQYEYDHRADQAVYLDKRYVERRLGALKLAYEQYQNQAAVHGGPACLEVFGEPPFVPETKDACLRLSEKQKKLSVQLQNDAAQLTNRYIPGEERSFTIIAFPMPKIGSRYREIFQEIVKINTLDSEKYRKIQQKLIDALDQGVFVHITGKGANETDLRIMLHPLKDPSKETAFENCVADVNIPVGEVFTSPVLAGTEGTLFVSRVYLNSLLYKDLKLTFQEGMVTGFSCGNFKGEQENRKYILENVMNYHESLPMGEFAIGTNTTAYVAAKTYGIADRLPILIAEKMGPHFAVGDTCYSHQEDCPVYNPDGKEIVARDNACSMLRKEDPAKAYFNTHVDITIPYEELEKISVIHQDGSERVLLADGRFVLPGTEELNEPFEK